MEVINSEKCRRVKAINMFLSISTGVYRDNQQELLPMEEVAFEPLDYTQIVRPLVLRDRVNGMSFYGIGIKYGLTYRQVQWICVRCARKTDRGIVTTEHEACSM